MKNFSVLLLLCSALYMLGCRGERSFFSNAGLIYTSLNKHTTPPPELKLSSEGIYRFDICAHDSVFYNTNILWFCDCTDPKSEGSVDSFAMAFVDEIRVVFFKKPKLDREINLGKLGKETRVGVYYWDFQTAIGGLRSSPLLVVRINAPRSKNKENEYTDLFFETRSSGLALVEVSYFDKDNSLTDLTRRKKKKNHMLEEDPKEGKRTIRPREVFALSEMLYRFVPEPVVLKLDGKKIEKIEYAAGGGQSFVRTTILKSGDKVLEQSNNQKSISTW